MRITKLVFALLFSITLIISGCASVPMASDAADQRAKQFKPVAGKANIYIYRDEYLGGALQMPVEVNGKNVGTTGPKTYIFLEVKPGKYNIMSDGNKDKEDVITINAKKGNNYYVWQEIKMGLLMGGTKLSVVDKKTGRKGVLECKLLKSPIK